MKSERAEHSAASCDLLIVHPGALGDVVAVFALIDRMKKRHRSVTLACQASIGKLAQSLNLADRHVGVETGFWSSIFSGRPRRQVAELLGGHRRIILFAVGTELENAINSHAPVPCVRVPPRPPAKLREHVTRYAAARLVASGLLDRIPPLTGTPCRRTHAGSQRIAAPGRPPVLLHPGAGSPRKRWPLSNFLAVAAKIRSGGGRAELIVGPAERDLLEAPLPSDLPVHVLDRMPDLLTLLKPAAGFIGNDSGVAHLAACLGLPTTVVFTCSDPLRWRPNGPAVEAVAPVLPCRPCFETRGENCPRPECLSAVTPEAVMRAHERLLKKDRLR